MTLPTDYQNFIALSRYARWLDDEKRRETWEETVARYFDFFQKHLADNHNYDMSGIRKKLEDAVCNLEVLPSMRALMTAGPALERSNIAQYNCSYAPAITATGKPDGFAEALYILMNGTGFGYTVENYWVSQMPIVADAFYDTDTTIVVADSKLGWAKACKQLTHLLYAGEIPKIDYSKIRPYGARLKTFGGRASGPEPLKRLFDFMIMTFRKAKGRKLSTLEVSDIFNILAEVVVVGGTRRAALISLSDLDDDKMRNSKSGAWWETTGYRRLANVSAIYEEKPDVSRMLREWTALYESKSGERGIFNRYAVNKKLKALDRDLDHRHGTNPCGEIILRPWEFCNLSTWIAREHDTLETMKKKIRLATILGTFQSTLTDFKFLSPAWKKNCEEERLLGVSICGVMDNPILSGKYGELTLRHTLTELKNYAREVNTEFAGILGINISKAITCLKPEGNSSQLVNAGSCIHPRYANYYIRNVRQDNKDPMTQFLKIAGIPWEADVMAPNSTTVFSFPIKSPDSAVFRKDMTAIEKLEHWAIVNECYCEHNPSVTIDVKEDEWLEVLAWVYKNFDRVQGVSFLPAGDDDHIYEQAPYQEIDEATYNEWVKKMPMSLNWDILSQIEEEDNTTGTQTLACVAGGCEL
jgi:ribonucleoside-diphosphate reductase alpha chain